MLETPQDVHSLMISLESDYTRRLAQSILVLHVRIRASGLSLSELRRIFVRLASRYCFAPIGRQGNSVNTLTLELTNVGNCPKYALRKLLKKLSFPCLEELKSNLPHETLSAVLRFAPRLRKLTLASHHPLDDRSGPCKAHLGDSLESVFGPRGCLLDFIPRLPRSVYQLGETESEEDLSIRDVARSLNMHMESPEKTITFLRMIVSGKESWFWSSLCRCRPLSGVKRLVLSQSHGVWFHGISFIDCH